MAGDSEEKSGECMQRLQSSFGTSSPSLQKLQQQQSFLMNQLEIPQLNMPQFRGQIRQFSPNSGIENSCKRVGIPPSHPQIPPISPYSQVPVNRIGNQQTGVQNFGGGGGNPGSSHHTRSLSQPAFFAHDLLPPLSPSPYNRESPPTTMSDHVSADASMDERDGCSNALLPPSPFTRCSSLRVGESLPPRRGHKRSNSDIPFGFSTMMQSSPPPLPLRSPGAQPVQLVKRESSWEKGGERNGEGSGERKTEVEVVDDLFSAYMNLDNIDAFNSSGTDEKLGNDNREDSRASGTKTNGCESSDNEATSSVNESGSSMSKPENREGIVRNAMAPTSRHYRSVSMDSFMGSMNFSEESPRMPPSPGARPGQLSPTNSIDSSAFSMEFGNGEFSGAEMKKIMANEKLAEIASSDPKRVKRILANRQSAARSKERKMRYIAELEHKVQTLQTEATTLSAQLTLLQRDSAGLTNQNNELKFRLQAMEQQAQLRDALNEALTGEVQRLKLATAELSGGDTSNKFQQLSINQQVFQSRHHQSPQLNMHQSQQQQQQQQSNGSSAGTHEQEQ